VTPSNKTDCTWANSTDDERALQKSAANAKDRVAACWYSGTTFDIDINLTDDEEHQVAIYCVDWAYDTMEMAVDVENAATSDVLSHQVVKNLHKGKYLVWKLKGHINLHITNNGPYGAPVSGILFDPPKQTE
jgi:hypothetical protein